MDILDRDQLGITATDEVLIGDESPVIYPQGIDMVFEFWNLCGPGLQD